MKILQSIKDAWVNAMTGMGKRKRDKSTCSTFEPRAYLDRVTLDALYTQSGLAARIVDRLPDDAVREKFTIKGADEAFDWNSIRSDLDDIKTDASLGDGWRWARLYGGCLVYPKLVDGMDPKEPLQRQRVKGIEGIELIESPYAQPVLRSDRSLLEPESYLITPKGSAEVLEVHKSRVFRFDGMRVPRSVLLENNGWAPSVLDRVFDQLMRMGDAYGNAGAILHVISQPVLKIANMREQLLSGSKEKKEIADLVEMIQEAASVMGWVTIDAADNFEAVDRNVEGLTKLLEKFVDEFVHHTGYPREILLGKTEGGLNTGENAGPFRNWYDQVGVEQEQKLAPAIDWILDLAFTVRENAGGFERPTEWQVEFTPLWQLSEKEQAEVDKIRAESDTLNYTMGAVQSEEVRARLVEQGSIPEPEQAEPLDLELPPPANDPPAEQGPAVQATALAGGQVTSLLEVVRAVAAGEIPRDAAIGVISVSFPQHAAQAEAILGSAGIGVSVQTPSATPGEPEEDGEPEPSLHAPPQGETLRSAKDLGEQLGVSAASIKSMHRRGEIGGWKIGGRWRFAASEVTAATHRPAAGGEE